MRVARGTGIRRAAIYLRKSTQGQKQSIDSQREECQQYAVDHGYEITGEYIDAGISGVDSRGKRDGFASLVADAEKGQFEFVICYELSRASRSKPRHFIVEMSPLADLGVRFCFTDKSEPIDLDNFTDYMTASIESHAANDYVMRLAKGTVRGQRDKAKKGLWVAGNPPVGLVADADGVLSLGADDDVKMVRDIFRWYVEGRSYRGIVKLLQDRGVKRGATFVASVLKNRLYVGDYVWNRKTQARFFSTRDGKIVKDFDRGATDADDHGLIEDNHPAIVDRDTFDRVQAMFEGRKRQSTPVRNSNFVLTGLCRCVHCGSNLTGFTSNGKPWLRCCGHQQHGYGKCFNNLIEQRVLLDAIAEALQKEFTDEEHIAVVRERYLARLEGDRDTVNVESVKRRRTDALRRFKQLKMRMMEVPADLVDDVAELVRDVKREIAGYDQQLADAEMNVDSIAAGFDDEVAAFGDQIRDLASALHDADPAIVRAFLSQTIEKIDVNISRRKAGSRYRYTFEGGEIRLNPGVHLPAAW